MSTDADVLQAGKTPFDFASPAQKDLLTSVAFQRETPVSSSGVPKGLPTNRIPDEFVHHVETPPNTANSHAVIERNQDESAPLTSATQEARQMVEECPALSLRRQDFLHLGRGRQFHATDDGRAKSR